MCRIATLALLAAFTTGCIVPLHRNNIVVDGVELEEKHTETIEVPAWDAAGLTIRSWGGELHIEATTGPNRITVTLHELTFGDASAVYEGGELSARTVSGEPYAIGDVTVHANGPLPSLSLATGMGDVLVHGVEVAGLMQLDTGMGDVEILDAGAPESVAASSGMGSIEMRRTKCGSLRATSGMGDIVLSEVTATEASLDSGLGDVTVRDSKLDSARATTGLGDIDCRHSELGAHEFDTGLGSVRSR